MKRLVKILITALFASCTNKYVSINLENATTHDSINILIYKQRKLLQSVWIKQSCADCFTTINVPVDSSTMSFVFVNQTMGCTDSTVVIADSIKKFAFVLVSSNEQIWYKGYELNAVRLEKDTLFTNFFCNTYYWMR